MATTRSRQDRLRRLLEKHGSDVWQPGKAPPRGRRTLASGFAELDRLLGGGWPLGLLTELLLCEPGAGELRLLLPALVQRGSQTHAQICFIAPPYVPYAPALAQHGLDLARLLVVNAERPPDALWATEQALRSGACGAVVAWSGRIGRRAIRRLQLAAEAGHGWAVICRSLEHLERDAAAPLRLQLEPRRDGLQVRVLRNRYGPTGTAFLSC